MACTKNISASHEYMDLVLSALSAKLPPKLISAIPLIKEVAELALKVGGKGLSIEERRDAALKALERIAAGDDGVFGTEDDRMSEEVLGQIRILLMSNMAMDLIMHFQQVASSTKKGRGSGCFGCFA